MKQWFTGKFRGHYRGRPSSSSALSPYAGAPHFRIEVYEALVSDIELGPLIVEAVPPEPPSAGAEQPEPTANKENDLAPTPPTVDLRPHHKPTGALLHQSHIGKAHLIDPVQRGQALRSTVHDVLMSGFELSRPAEFSGGSLGHIEGIISGWYRPPPPPPEVEEVPAHPGPPAVGWRTEVLHQQAEDSPEARIRPPSLREKSPEKPGETPDLADDLASEEELDAALSYEAPDVEYPFFGIGMGITLLLAFLASPFSASIFGVTFLLSYGARRWLVGVIPDVAGVRVLSLFLGSTQIVVAALLIARFEATGCVSLAPLPLIWLLGAQMAASLLPRPLPFALTTAGFAAVLLQAYASWAPPLCGAESTQAPLAEPAVDVAPAESL